MAEIKVEAQVLQQGGWTPYSFVLNSKVLKAISYALPRTTDAPYEIQRIRIESRCKEIGAPMFRARIPCFPTRSL